jgi:hypothetical protein
MTQPDIKLDSAALRSHATMVDEAAHMCDEAASAAKYVDGQDGAYGLLCGRLVGLYMNPLQDWALRELRSSADATAHLAQLVRAVADDADTTDATAAQRFRTGA